MRATLSVIVVLLLVMPLVGAQTKNEPPRVHQIESRLERPFNYYSVEALDPELAQLTYTWTIANHGRCDAFTSSGATATWRHDDEERCPHEAAHHPGTITVVVSDGKNSVTRSYANGSAPYDPGEPDWRTSGTSFFGGNEEGDDPRDFPPPTIYGEELDCPAPSAAGAFEPVQSVWQDENTDKFPDLPGKQLTVNSPVDAEAELDLVVGKLTQLFGVRTDRKAIYYNGTVTGTQRVAAVVRFTLHETPGDFVLGEIDVGDMYLGGEPCSAPRPFNFKFDTTTGLQLRHFLPHREGGYTIKMELAQRGGPVVPESAVTVAGKLLKVHEPRVYFVGTIVSSPSANGTLASAARRLADASALNIPDYFPLPTNGFKATYRPTDRDLRPTIARALERCEGNLSAFDWCRVNAARTAIESTMAGTAWVLRSTTGDRLPVDRVAIVVSRADMDGFLYPPAGSANGFAAADKTFFQHAETTHYTTAHEFAHTVPRYAWLHPAPDDCTITYHNTGTGLGHGFQLSQRGAPARIPQGPKHGLMQGGAADRWIEQCTYENLLRNLNGLADPPLVGVRGWLVKNGTLELGAFEPGMSFDGAPDRTPGGTGRFAVVFADASGRTLAEYRFDHPLSDDAGRATPMIAFAMALERPAGLARIDLVGENGTLATRVVTASAPRLTIVEPAAGSSATPGQPLHVSWSASDADGGELTYGVAFSADDGETWLDMDFDINATQIDVPAEFLAQGTKHIVRVMATDGVNSVEVERAIGPRPPSSSGTATSASPTPTPSAETAGSPGPGLVLVLAGVALALLARRRG